MSSSAGVLPTPADLDQVQRRTMLVLVGAQVLSGAGLAAGITVGALLAQDMIGATSLSGAPVAVFTVGSALAAVLVGRVSHRAGRRSGLTLGYAAGAVGSIGVVVASATDSLALLFASLFVYGAGTATNLQARYAGADLVPPSHRGRSVSTVLVATTLGAVVGPNLVTLTGDLATMWGARPLAGPFALAAAAYGAAALVLWVLLRPDPLLLSRAMLPRPGAVQAIGTSAAPESGSRAPWSRGIAVGATVMVLTQMVMIAIMTMTPVHMEGHGHGLGTTGVVIAVHVGAMYLPSPLTGYLVDRVGRLPVAASAGVVLLAAGVVGATAPPTSSVALALALGLLGLGWNLGLLSGTAMITDAAPPATRARTQGAVDLCIALAGAGSGMASGFVLAATSYATLSLAGGILALTVIPVVAAVHRRPAA